MPGETGNKYKLGFIVAVVAFIVYANSLFNGFTMDDHSVILNNPVLQGTPASLFSAIDTTNNALPLPYYRPLTYLSFLIEGQLHGFTPFYIRLFNILLHCGNAFLLYQLARTLFKDNYAPLLVGLLFAVHPLNTEAVDFNAGGRNTLLACFFALTAYLCHRKSVIRERVSGTIAGALLLLAGLFSKESALAILPFIAALEFKYLRSDATTPGKLRMFSRILPYAAAILFYLIMRWLTLSRLGIQTGIIPGFGTNLMKMLYIIPDLSERLINNLYIIPFYLFTIIRPTALSPSYYIPEDLHLLALPLSIAWLGIIIVIFWLVNRGRSQATLFGLLWLIAFWLPVSGIFWFGSTPLADRYIYIPAIGFWIIIADQITRFLPANPQMRRYSFTAAAFVLVVMSALTIRRNLDWKSNIALFSRVVEQYPENGFGHAYLGISYYMDRKQDSRYIALAEQEFTKSLNFPHRDKMVYTLSVHTRMGHILQDRKDYESALFHYNEALAIYPLDREVLVNRAQTLEYMGKIREALIDYAAFLSTSGDGGIPGARAIAESKLRDLSQRLEH